MYSDLVLPHLSVRSILTGRTVCGHGVAGQKHFPRRSNHNIPVWSCQMKPRPGMIRDGHKHFSYYMLQG